jgi:adenylate kinase family enzyme
VQRIAIGGCGGSGKTWLARHLGARLDLPVTHLDALYYDETWRTAPPEQFAARQRALVVTPRWVIDGNFAEPGSTKHAVDRLRRASNLAPTLPIRLGAADTVVFLDLPASTCLRGMAQRRRRARVPQDPRTGVYDRITVEFLRYVLGYRRRMRPRVERLTAEHAGDAQVVVLRSRRAVQRWVRHELPAGMAVGGRTGSRARGRP